MSRKKKKVRKKLCSHCKRPDHTTNNCPLAEPLTDEMLGINDSETNIELKEMINHPDHYGGEDNLYETIKVIEAWEANFNIGNCIKYLSRYDKKGKPLEDLKKAKFYLNREIELYESFENNTTVTCHPIK